MNAELIALAETLDAARIAANAIEAAAPQDGVYGHTERALNATLELITGTADRAAVVYQSILDGNTVAQGLAWELASREPEAEELRARDLIAEETKTTN